MASAGPEHRSAIELAALIRARELSPVAAWSGARPDRGGAAGAERLLFRLSGEAWRLRGRPNGGDGRGAVGRAPRRADRASRTSPRPRARRTTLGSCAFEHWVPDRDAQIVQRLRAAGAIMVGKTTTPEFAHAGFTQSPLWGITRNPWDPRRTPGGSSGGSGAAVASGCVPLAEGTDMGGSVRIPAALCGLVGLKPSLGRIPMDILPTVFD